MSGQIVVPFVLATVYALLHCADPHLPPMLTRVLHGSNTPPSYPTDNTNKGQHTA
ncbi:hypothetical protein [Saccharopolyspora spinosa]|uniref:Uncharacterized protein n=1 Tax=Saccharopolyspora spinosa TaxID=60894 RepID=A0A2N3XPL3_SACSN|nr:hypothetical protein [Saccharopolyspora spinosa]PKW12614.1 hypothetical protein A8926_0079 [Saccharopolyspora spinosa]